MTYTNPVHILLVLLIVIIPFSFQWLTNSTVKNAQNTLDSAIVAQILTDGEKEDDTHILCVNCRNGAGNSQLDSLQEWRIV